MTQNTRPDQPKKSGEIENELGQTRNALQQDIKALGDKFSPGHIKDEAKNALSGAKDAAVDKLAEAKDMAVEKLSEAKDVAADKLNAAKDATADALSDAKEKLTEAKDATMATVSETVDEVSYQARKIGGATWDFTRTNAVPLALVGIGAGWLLANTRGSRRGGPRRPGMRSRRADYAVNEPYGDMDDRALLADNERDLWNESRSLSTSPRQRPRPRAYSGGSAASRVASEASEAGGKLGERAERMYGQAGETIANARQKLAGGVMRGRDAVKSSLQRAGAATRDYAEDNPIALGVVTLAAGVGIGLLLPSTERENRLLGSTRDRFFGEARDTARGIGNVARETVKETSNAFR
jgi:ElaB/YqjD/DUF883 family membrane-anchored ribosome-binding protein